MKFIAQAAAMVGAMLASAPEAVASCKDDIVGVQAEAAHHPKDGDQGTLRKELAKAQDLAPWDEVGCLNAVARARKALKAPPPQAAPKGAVQPLNQR
jgi:hypothetical protein